MKVMECAAAVNAHRHGAGDNYLGHYSVIITLTKLICRCVSPLFHRLNKLRYIYEYSISGS